MSTSRRSIVLDRRNLCRERNNLGLWFSESGFFDRGDLARLSTQAWYAADWRSFVANDLY